MIRHSAIYEGRVVHDRRRPRRHRLEYRVFSFLLDIDELPELDRSLGLFAHNRSALFSFHDRDHGDLTGASLRTWVEERLAEAGIDLDGGDIRLLCYPRILGYAFNPLSVYFCHRPEGGLAAILYEVRNTFNERHTYVIPVTEAHRAVVSQRAGKQLYVSPFVAMDADYHFRIQPPGEEVRIAIREEDAEGLLLAAAFRGTRTPLGKVTLARLLFRYPAMTLKVTAAIHWEALRIWLKGVPWHGHIPAPAPVRSSVWRNEIS